MKKTISITIDKTLHEQVKDLIYWTPGLSVSGLINELLLEVLNNLDEKPKLRPDRLLKAGRKME